jgi:hypothetical protein
MVHQHCILSRLGTDGDSEVVRTATCSARRSNWWQGRSSCVYKKGAVSSVCAVIQPNFAEARWHKHSVIWSQAPLAVYNQPHCLYVSCIRFQFTWLLLFLLWRHRHRGQSQWTGGKQKEFKKLKILFDYIRCEEANLVMCWSIFRIVQDITGR